MKRVLKAVGRSCWRATGPVRRPIAGKFRGMIAGMLTQALQEQVAGPVLPRLDELREAARNHELGLNLARHEVEVQGVETNLALDSLVREVARLQLMIEALQQSIEERSASSDDGLSLVRAEDEAGLSAAG